MILILFLSIMLSSNAHAERERKGKPPEAAFSACDGLEQEASCSFNNNQGEAIDGTCMVPRKSQNTMVCKPNRGQKKGKSRKKRDEYNN